MPKHKPPEHDPLLDEPPADAPDPSTAAVIAEAEAAVTKPAWRDVVHFVCVKCGQPKRSEPHLDFVCKGCHAAAASEAPAK